MAPVRLSFFQSAETVCQPRCARDCPIAGFGLLVAVVRMPIAFQFVGDEARLDVGIFAFFRQAECGRAVADKCVAQQDDRCHVFDCDSCCFKRHVEAVGGRSGRQYDKRAFAVSPVEGLAKVGLFGFGRKSCGRAAALHVDDDQRKFGHDSQSDAFAFQREAGARCGGHCQIAGKRSSDGGADTGNFILHLAGFHAQVFAFCKFVEDVGCRSDGVAAQIERASRFFRCVDQAPRCGGVSVHVGISSGTGFAWLDAVGRHRSMDVMPVVVAAGEHFGVGFVDGRFFPRICFSKVKCGIERAVEEPAHQSERENIAAAKHRLHVEAGLGKRAFHHRRDGHFHNLRVQSDFFVRIVGCVECFFQVRFFEGIDVDNGNAAFFEEFRVLLQGCRIHGYQHVGQIARRMHAFSDVHLKSRNAAQCALRCTDFRRIVGECGDLIAHAGRHV